MFITRTTLVLGLLFGNFGAHAGEALHDIQYYQSHIIANLVRQEDSLGFVATGNWGYNGHYSQRAVANWMDVAMYQIGGTFIVSTGNNFYYSGIASIEDPLWQTAYERVYHGPQLLRTWYSVLGDVDYLGNWQAQIDYSNKSQRWTLPAPYYAKTWALPSGPQILVLFIDTTPIDPRYRNSPIFRDSGRQDTPRQMVWIHEQLASSKAHWKIVVGHHSLYSSGADAAETEGLRYELESLFEQFKVDVYLSGHESNLQHNLPLGKTVSYIVSGAGALGYKTSQHPYTRFAASTPGFVAISVGADRLTSFFINEQGEMLYRYDLDKPRS